MSVSLSVLLTLTLAAPPGPAAGEPRAEITGERWQALTDAPEPAKVGAWAQRRTLKLTVTADGIVVRGRWVIRAAQPGWFASGLVGPGVHIREARWNGRAAALWPSSTGTLVVGRVTGKAAVLELDAFIPGGDTRELPLLGATSGEVEVVSDTPMRVVADGEPPVVRERGRFLTGAPSLRLERIEPPTKDDRTIAVARAAVGLTVGDDVVHAKGHLQYVLRKGELKALDIAVANVGDDLELTGTNVRAWKREGDRVHVDLHKPSRSLVDIALTWTAPVARATQSTFALPTIEPQDVFRTESSLQLARDGEVDAVPDIRGWSTVAGTQLPAWGKGLVEGSPTAAYRRAGAGYESGSTLAMFRFEAVPGPPIVAEIADVVIATSAEGRALLRARYEIRNERAPYLEVRPPPGMKLVGAWVLGEPVRASLVDGAWRVPTPRSLETLEGLVTFPVVVAMLGEHAAWRRSDKRRVELPTLGAPINVSRVTMHLPLQYRSLLEPGKGSVVSSFTRGNEVGYGLADENLRGEADAAYRRAVDSWNDNDFEGAQRELNNLDKLGAKSKNQQGLKANVDAVTLTKPAAASRDDSPRLRKLPSPAPPASTRRLRSIKGKVRARAGKTKAKQFERKKRAKKLKDEGRYEEAAQEYERALEDTQLLRKFEDEESAEYEAEEQEIAEDLKETRRQRKARRSLESSSTKKFIADEGEFADVLVPDPPDRPEPTGPAILVPRAGRPVLYQLLLLEPGARRSVPVDARRSPPTRRTRR